MSRASWEPHAAVRPACPGLRLETEDAPIQSVPASQLADSGSGHIGAQIPPRRGIKKKSVTKPNTKIFFQNTNSLKKGCVQEKKIKSVVKKKGLSVLDLAAKKYLIKGKMAQKSETTALLNVCSKMSTAVVCDTNDESFLLKNSLILSKVSSKLQSSKDVNTKFDNAIMSCCSKSSCRDNIDMKKLSTEKMDIISNVEVFASTTSSTCAVTQKRGQNAKLDVHAQEKKPRKDLCYESASPNWSNTVMSDKSENNFKRQHFVANEEMQHENSKCYIFDNYIGVTMSDNQKFSDSVTNLNFNIINNNKNGKVQERSTASDARVTLHTEYIQVIKNTINLKFPLKRFFKCCFCPKLYSSPNSCSNKQSIKNHLERKHNISANFLHSCGFCNEGKFQNVVKQEYVTKHITLVHNEELEQFNVTNKCSYDNVCDICSESFPSKSALAHHIVKHTIKRPKINDIRLFRQTIENSKPGSCYLPKLGDVADSISSNISNNGAIERNSLCNIDEFLNCDITDDDLQELLSKETYLSDITIDTYLKSVATKEVSDRGIMPLSCQYLRMFSDNFIDSMYLNLQKFSKFNTFVIPININNNHWIVATMILSKKMIILIDPQKIFNHQSCDEDLMGKLLHLWCFLPGNVSMVGNKQPDIRTFTQHPLQLDSYSCGVHVCLIAKCIMNGFMFNDNEQILYPTNDMFSHRIDMFEVITDKTNSRKNTPIIDKSMDDKEDDCFDNEMETLIQNEKSPLSIPKPKHSDPEHVIMCIDQIKHWYAMNNDQNWNQFEDIVMGFFAQIQTSSKKSTSTSYSSKFNEPKKKEGLDFIGLNENSNDQNPYGFPIQKSGKLPMEQRQRVSQTYKHKKKTTFRKITEEKSSECDISLETLEEHFQNVYSDLNDNVTLSNIQHLLPSSPVILEEEEKKWVKDNLLGVITKKKVINMLRKHSDTCPGTDGIKYSDLLKLDPNGTALTAIFNVCLKFRKIPRNWKDSNITLLYKKGDRANPANYRPIALSSTIYKTYTGILADRLANICTKYDLTSPIQKGFMPKMEGCLENIFVLDDMIHRSRSEGKNLAVAWIDLTNAFGSVSHRVIKYTMEKLGLPKHFVEIVQDMYRNSYNTIKTKIGITNKIEIKCGVKQGDPLSPLLFNLSIEPLIRKILGYKSTRGFEGYTGKHIIQAYADDIVILSKSADDLQFLIREMVATLKDIGLSCNVKKCGTLYLPKGKINTEKKFFIMDKDIPQLSLNDVYMYLGNPCGIGIDQCSMDLVVKCMHLIDKVERSELLPWQKLDAIKTFISPKMAYLFRSSKINISLLRELDKLLMSTARLICRTGKMANKNYFLGAVSQGGIGLTSFTEEYSINAITHVFRLLTSPSEDVKSLAWSSLEQETMRWTNKKNTDITEMLSFLNASVVGNLKPCESRSGSNPSSIWSKARICMRLLQKHINCVFNLNAKGMLKFTFDFKEGIDCFLDASNRKSIYKALRQRLGTYHIECLLNECPSQSRNLQGAKMDPATNKLILKGKVVGPAEWNFIHKAKLNLVPVFGKQFHKKENRKCRRCSHPFECLTHVLGRCSYNMSELIYPRHDNILNKLTNIISKYNIGLEIAVDKVCPVSEKGLRPDLIITDHATNTKHILDVSCVNENRRDKLEEMRTLKIVKYFNEAQNYSKQGFHVLQEGFIMGTLGAWHPNNTNILKQFNVPPKVIKKFRKGLTKDVIHDSKNIFWSHLIGREEYASGIYDGKNNINHNVFCTDATIGISQREVSQKPPSDGSNIKSTNHLPKNGRRCENTPCTEDSPRLIPHKTSSFVDPFNTLKAQHWRRPNPPFPP